LTKTLTPLATNLLFGRLDYLIRTRLWAIASSGNSDFLRRIGTRIAPYFVITNIVAVTIGGTLALWIEPGQYIEPAAISKSKINFMV